MGMGEPRATQDLDFVINLPVKAIGRFSKELEKRNMLVPADIILDTMGEDRTDIPLSAIHIYSGLKADLYLMRDGDELRRSAFQAASWWTMVHRLERCMSIPLRI